MFARLSFRQAEGSRIPDRLQQDLAVFRPMYLVDRCDLEGHFLGILSEAPGFIDIGGLCGNTRQALRAVLFRDTELSAKEFTPLPMFAIFLVQTHYRVPSEPTHPAIPL